MLKIFKLKPQKHGSKHFLYKSLQAVIGIKFSNGIIFIIKLWSQKQTENANGRETCEAEIDL